MPHNGFEKMPPTWFREKIISNLVQKMVGLLFYIYIYIYNWNRIPCCPLFETSQNT